jgi:hypothetical protein
LADDVHLIARDQSTELAGPEVVRLIGEADQPIGHLAAIDTRGGGRLEAEGQPRRDAIPPERAGPLGRRGRALPARPLGRRRIVRDGRRAGRSSNRADARPSRDIGDRKGRGQR